MTNNKINQMRYCNMAPVDAMMSQVYNDAPNGVLRGAGDPSKLWPGGIIKWWAPNHQDVPIVECAMHAWESVSGLDFQRQGNISTSDIRINFDYLDGSYSFVGTDALLIPQQNRTMNFGWPLDSLFGFGTALHEVGHAIGMVHEHQSPTRPLVFDQPFLDNLFGDPAFVQSQIIDIRTNATLTTAYDSDSIMHYNLPAGGILSPPPYSTTGVSNDEKLSELDVEWAQLAYPPAVDDCPNSFILFTDIITDDSSLCGPCGDPAIPQAPLFWEKSIDGGTTWIVAAQPSSSDPSNQAGDQWRYVCPDGPSNALTLG